MRLHLVAQSAVFADRRFVGHGIQLYVLDGVSKCATAAITHRHGAIYFDYRNMADFLLRIAAMNAICILRVANCSAAAIGKHLVHIESTIRERCIDTAWQRCRKSETLSANNQLSRTHYWSKGFDYLLKYTADRYGSGVL